MEDLNDPLTKDKFLGKSLLHNKFGCCCLQANLLTKALDHFNKALNLIDNKTFFTNIYQNMGNVYAQERNYDEAIKYYQMVLDFSPHNNEKKNEYNEISKEILFDKSINSYDAYVDAHTNLAVMYLTKNEAEQALKFCSKSLELKKDNFEAAINFGDILRQVGQKDFAIEFTWDLIVKYTNAMKPETNYQVPKLINCISDKKNEKEEEQKIVENINVLCVKWGTRYDAEYVNKLFRGIKRNTTKPFKFHCFTEDVSGLLGEINAIKLKEDWKGWWGKATLFSQDYGLKGKMFYIDLDMIITGNIDDIMEYKGKFGLLKSDEIACEKKNKSGYNSSIIIWNENIVEPIYLELKKNFEGITKFIVRFDFWLEMMVKNADFLQDLYPNQIADYLSKCQEKLDSQIRIVCFPRIPKPDTYPSEWIKEHWI